MANKSILFINQSSGYLMIDIINAHVPYYDNLVLLTGFLNPRETALHKKVEVKKITTYRRTSTLQRLLTWFTFWIQTLFYVFVKYRNHKLYFVTNPPLNILIARWTNREFAYLFYDVFPAALAQKNIIKKNSSIYKFWENTNQIVFRKAKHLFTLSEGMQKLMKIPSECSEKSSVVDVWTNNSFFKTIDDQDNQFIEQYNLKNKFIVGYSGNLGKTHPVEKIIDIAEALIDEEDILFLIIGEGEKKTQLLEMQKHKILPNLKILDFQPTRLFPHVLAAFNIGIVTLEPLAADLSVPSKTYNLMSAGKPILSIAKHSSGLAQIITKNKIGKNFSSTEIKSMCKFILKLKNNDTYYQKIQRQSKNTSYKFTPENAKKMILK